MADTEVENLIRRAAPIADMMNKAIEKSLTRSHIDGIVLLAAMRLVRNNQLRQVGEVVKAQFERLEQRIDHETIGVKTSSLLIT